MAIEVGIRRIASIPCHCTWRAVACFLNTISFSSGFREKKAFGALVERQSPYLAVVGWSQNDPRARRAARGSR
jgi:hypothetical protein